MNTFNISPKKILGQKMVSNYDTIKQNKILIYCYAGGDQSHIKNNLYIPMVGPMVNNDLFIFLPLPFKPQKSESKFCSHTHFENNMTSVSMAANKLNVSWKTKSRHGKHWPVTVLWVNSSFSYLTSTNQQFKLYEMFALCVIHRL